MCSVSAPRGGHRTGRGLAGWPVGDLLEAEGAAAILDGEVSGLVFAHQHTALGRSMAAALAFELEQLAFVANDPDAQPRAHPPELAHRLDALELLVLGEYTPERLS